MHFINHLCKCLSFIFSESKNLSQYTSETKMSPSSLYSQQVLCSSIPLSKNVHSFFSAFCTEENIEQSISYLDQVTCFFCTKQEYKSCSIVEHTILTLGDHSPLQVYGGGGARTCIRFGEILVITYPDTR